jgi:hypothetical protein
LNIEKLILRKLNETKTIILLEAVVFLSTYECMKFWKLPQGACEPSGKGAVSHVVCRDICAAFI